MLNLIPRCIQPREIIVKKGSTLRLKYLVGKRAAIIAGQNSLRASGKLNDIMAHLTSAGMDVTLLDPVKGEPVIGSIQNYAEKLKVINPDWIIACGGGSVLDTAKLAQALFENPDNQLADFYRPFSVPEAPYKSKLIAMPTTSGSGSEMSSIAVVIDPVEKKKIPINSMPLVPHMVILDSSLALTLSPKMTVMTGLDALTHAFEAYCSSASHAWTDMYALSAGKSIYENLEKVLEMPSDNQARERLLYASSQAGYAQNTAYVGAAHAFAHTLGALFGVNHGLACGLFLPRVALVDSKFTPKAEDFVRASGFQSINHFADWVYQLLERVGLPQSWQDAIGKGIEINQREIVKAAMADPCIRTAPKKLTAEQWNQVLSTKPSCAVITF